MSRLEEWYGVEGARRLRAQQRRRHLSGPFDVKPTGYTSTGAEGSVQLTAARSALKAKMEKVLTELRTAALDAMRRVEQKPSLLVPTEVKKNYINSLKSLLTNTIPIRAASMQDVLDGRLSPEKWMQACQEVANGINAIYSGIYEDTVLASWSAVFKGVMSDFTSAATTLADITRALARLAKDMPEQIDKYGSLGILALLGMGAFILYQYATAALPAVRRGADKLVDALPSGPVNGYNGRSTHRRRRR